MTPKLKKLQTAVNAKRHEDQLPNCRELLAEYLDELSRSWWERFKRFFKPHFEVSELPPYQHIKMLLLQTPEDKKVELINKLVDDGEHHFLLNYLTAETIEKIIEIGEDKMWGER